MHDMNDALSRWAESQGGLVAWGPAGPLLEQVRSDLEQRVTAGEIAADAARGGIDRAFAVENLTFDYDCGGLDGGMLVMIAMPRPAHLVGFVHDGARLNLLMPPTYERYRPTFEDVRRDLAEGPLRGFRVKVVRAPLKLLAARLGLVRYGRNNLTYAPGLGSYMQLLGYVTDAPLPIASDWKPSEPALLDECADCGICAAVCPTGAIPEDRILLRAERCLTLANETAGDWPAHVPKSVHHCLIGCLICQKDCPANPTLPIVDTGVVFTEEETRALLTEGDGHDGTAWRGIRRHLDTLGQPYQEPVVGRNLRAFLLAGYD